MKIPAQISINRVCGAVAGWMPSRLACRDGIQSRGHFIPVPTDVSETCPGHLRARLLCGGAERLCAPFRCRAGLRQLAGLLRGHTSWQWKLHGQVVQLLGLLAIAVCGMAWKKRKELHQSPLLPALLVGLLVFLAAFGIWACAHVTRPVIVSVHLAGGIAMLLMLVWIALRQMAPPAAVDPGAARKLRGLSRLGLALLLVQIMLGGWVSSNFAALACTGFPLCNGALLPAMDFSWSLDPSGLPLSTERLTAIHWVHRLGAVVTAAFLGWLSLRLIAVHGLHNLGRVMLGLVALQFTLGVLNVLLGLPLLVAVLHNAVAMSLLVALVTLAFRLRERQA